MACGTPRCGGKGNQVIVRTEPVIKAHSVPRTARQAPAASTPGAVHKLILRNWQSPGDIMMMTAAVRDLHRAYPGRFLTGVNTSASEIWANNPYISNFDPKGAKEIDLGYTSLINQSNTTPHHFVHGFVHDLEEKLGIRVPCTELKGEIYISDAEKGWINQVAEEKNGGYKGQFWLVAAGGKYDFTAKWWHPDFYQEVVDHFLGRITFVQVGKSDEHFHTPLKNVIDLTGKTNLRQLIRLVYHSVGVLCPVTFLMHAAAATPSPHPILRNRAGVVIAGGREPANWEAYPFHRFLSNQGALPCCSHGGCWCSRATLVLDGDSKNKNRVCERPVVITPKTPYPKDKIDGSLKIGRCMEMITPRAVIEAIESYYNGGVLSYQSHELK
jgi:hypothetical protein